MPLFQRIRLSLIILLALALAACDTNQPRLSLLEPEPIINNNVTSALINLQAPAGATVQTSLNLQNSGNNTLSFSLLSADNKHITLTSNLQGSTLVDAGEDQAIELTTQCPSQAGNYPTTFTIKSNDTSKPEIIIAVILACR